ncbi:leucine-rich repeat domain-containing protein [Chloroflexota bacterium]
MRVRIFGTLSLSLLFVITFSVALVTTGLAQPPDETPVTFPDANLEAAIREAIDKPEGLIFTSDLDGLTSLKTKGITDLTGLEYCSNLTELDLAWNKISNISPLSNLTDLTYLGLGGNEISDISPLSNLTDLTYLSLAWNEISDISPLANLTKLTELHLEGNQIADASPLVENSGLGAKDKLWLLRGNPLSDTSLSVYIPQLKKRGVSIPRPKTALDASDTRIEFFLIPLVAFIAALVVVLLFYPTRGKRWRRLVKSGLIVGVVLTGVYTLLTTFALTFDVVYLEDLLFGVWIPGLALYGIMVLVIIIGRKKG